MPFDSAVYLIDCFFYDGAKVMFQLALTILQKNKDQIMKCSDEGDSISLLATYLESIESPDRKIQNPTGNISELLRESYENFGSITEEDVNKLRLKYRLKVVQNMEESLLNSIARSVFKECQFNNDQIKDLFYIFKQVSKIGIIDGARDNLTISKEQFLKLNKELSEWKALGNEEIASKIFDFLKRCPSEKVSEPKISRLINSSMVTATTTKQTPRTENNESIDFLHFIRYMNIIYKSDINLRLKFLYAVCLKDDYNKIEIYNILFTQPNLKNESITKRTSTLSLNPNESTNEVKKTFNELPKSQMPMMNQDEFISFWRIVYNLFTDLENEAEMYHAAATVSTILLKIGEASKKFPEESEKINRTYSTQDIKDPELENETKISSSSTVCSGIEEPRSNNWRVTFEQLLASLLTDNLLVEYFDTKFNLDKILADYKSKHG